MSDVRKTAGMLELVAAFISAAILAIGMAVHPFSSDRGKGPSGKDIDKQMADEKAVRDEDQRRRLRVQAELKEEVAERPKSGRRQR